MEANPRRQLRPLDQPVQIESRNMGLVSGARTQRTILAIVLVGVEIYSEHLSTQKDQALSQAIIWTIGVFGLFLIHLGKTLERPRLRLLALILAAAHFYLVHSLSRRLPFKSFLALLILIAAESMFLVILYTRGGQSIDPNGPFGLTEAEKSRKLKPLV